MQGPGAVPDPALEMEEIIEAGKDRETGGVIREGTLVSMAMAVARIAISAVQCRLAQQ